MATDKRLSIGFLRRFAWIAGWFWILCMIATAIYGYLTGLLGVKGPAMIAFGLFFATPGAILIWWGKRPRRFLPW